MHCTALTQSNQDQAWQRVRILLVMGLALALTLFWQGAAHAQEDAQVTVGHFAPFGADVESTAVDVYVNDEEVLTGFSFGDIAGPLLLPAGVYTLEARIGVDVAISATVEITSGASYFVAAIGDGDPHPLELRALQNETEGDDTFAKLRVAHFSPFAADPAETGVDICTSAGGNLFPNLEYGDIANATPAAGNYDLAIAVAGTDCANVVLDLPEISLAVGEIADVFAIGIPGSEAFPFRVVTSTGLNLTAAADVTVAHFAAFADSVVETAVDIRVNGATVLTDVVFGDIDGPLTVNATLPPSQTFVEVVVGDTVALSGTFSLEPGVSYFLAAVGDGPNQPLELLAAINDTEGDTENAKLRLAHLSPFNEDLEVTAVDICHNEGTPVLEGLKYGDITNPYIVLPPGDYNLVVALANTNCATVFDIPALHVAAGDILDAFAIGYPVGAKAAAFPFELKSTTGLTFSVPATVTVGHFAPFAPTVEETAVSIYVNGTEILSNTVFGDIATTQLAPGRVRVDVVPTTTEAESDQLEPAISQVFTLTQGLDYSLLAVGGVNGWALELRPLVNDRSPSDTLAKVRIGHLAPFAVGLEATSVAICDAGTNTAIPGLESVPYSVITEGYLQLPAGEYALKISPANNCAETLLALPVLALEAGDIIEVFAIGLNTPEFPLSIVVIGEVTTIQPPAAYTIYAPTLTKGGPVPSITEIAVSNPDFSMLVTALNAAGLADTLAGEGDFTVFAPTNAAFNALPEDLRDQALADPSGLLTQVLLYHVLGSRVPSSALSEGLTATTLQGGELVFSLEGGATVNGVSIIDTNIYASNGIIHVINAVLLPQLPE